ncbi:MAG: hypothetical protein ACYC7J_07495 [Syntrophales bacterium]
MRSISIGFLGLALVGVLLLSQVVPSGYTRVHLSTEGRGKPILSAVVPDGERICLTWHNSLFRLDVTEVFFARGGVLIQDQVTFSVPGGPPPPRVPARDVDDLYHTGGPFDARGLSRPFSRIVYRIGEIGNPKLQVKGKTAVLKKEAGFGGRVILAASRPALHEIIFHR